MRQIALSHTFVEQIPESLSDGVLYISTSYAIVVHLCCCGCQVEVVTPLSPTDWKLSFDGETISLFPSIGNWGMPCESHYWVRDGEVIWSRKLSVAQIARVREKDRILKAAAYRRNLQSFVDMDRS